MCCVGSATKFKLVNTRDVNNGISNPMYSNPKIRVFGFRPKKQQFLVALPTP